MILLQGALKLVIRQQQAFAIDRRFGERGTGELPDGGDFSEGSAGRGLMQDCCLPVGANIKMRIRPVLPEKTEDGSPCRKISSPLTKRCGVAIFSSIKRLGPVTGKQRAGLEKRLQLVWMEVMTLG